MSPRQTMRRIVLPQAMRVIIPPMGNETIDDAEDHRAGLGDRGARPDVHHRRTSTRRTTRSSRCSWSPAIWYLALTSVLGVRQAWLERRYGRGSDRAARVAEPPLARTGELTRSDRSTTERGAR